MERITKDIQEKLKKLAEQEFDMLIVEDNIQYHPVMKSVFKRVFPKAKIHFLKSFNDGSFENQVVLMQYHFFALDANVSGLGEHSRYGINAFKAIPFIREHNSDAIIMGMSTSPKSNEAAMRLGADFTLEKENIHVLTLL